MKRAIQFGLLGCVLVAVACTAFAQEFEIGADISFARQAEKQGVIFYDQGNSAPVLQILSRHGYNWVRLRLFVAPTDLPNNLEYTIATAKEAKQLGYKFLLDLHYSDTWADPEHQIMPKAWAGKSHDELVQAVFEYTRDTILAFRNAEVLPDMVQIGNEVTVGIMWPDGKLPDQWKHFGDLVKAGIRGVDAATQGVTRPKIMIHIDKGGDIEATQWFFDNLKRQHVEFDVIGQSYYPWWHGSIEDLQKNLKSTAKRYRKPIVVVETAYNWQPGNFVKRPGPFPETPEGQRQFLAAVAAAVRGTPDGLGVGVFWWEPAVTGHLAGRGVFDEQHNALPVITVFDKPPH